MEGARPSCPLVSTYEMVGLFTEAAGRSVGLKHGCANALQRLEAGQSGHAGAEAAEGGTENEGKSCTCPGTCCRACRRGVRRRQQSHQDHRSAWLTHRTSAGEAPKSCHRVGNAGATRLIRAALRGGGGWGRREGGRRGKGGERRGGGGEEGGEEGESLLRRVGRSAGSAHVEAIVMTVKQRQRRSGSTLPAQRALGRAVRSATATT